MSSDSVEYVHFGADIVLKRQRAPAPPTTSASSSGASVIFCVDQLAAPLCDALMASRQFEHSGSIYVTHGTTRTKVSDVHATAEGDVVLVRNVIGASVAPAALRNWVAASVSGLKIDKAIILDGLCVRAYHDGSAVIGGSDVTYLHSFAANELVNSQQMQRFARMTPGKVLVGCTAALLNYFETRQIQSVAFISERDLTYSVESARRFEALLPLIGDWCKTPSIAKPSHHMYHNYVAKDAYLISTANLYC